MGDRENTVFLFFIDGLGIGSFEGDNPLASIPDIAPLANFVDRETEIPLGGVLVRTDARLGVEGRPQSASGQTTILTGVNAPRLLGNHKQGFPNQALRDIIAENSIFKKLENAGIGPNVFANAYTPRFFSEGPRWKSATTCAVEASSMGFRKISDLLGGKALFHDFTNEGLRVMGIDVPIFSVGDGARVLSGLAARHRFTLYEHFLTDKIGHDRDLEKARLHLPALARLIRETLELIDLEKTTFMITSDHGNLEDMSVRNHTLNDVPTIIWGRKKLEAAARIKDLADITPTIISLLNPE